jgi:hypothetical protein
VRGGGRPGAAYGHAHWSAAQFGRKDGGLSRIERMRAALQEDGLSNEDITYLHFGLFKELDTLDDTDAAWDALVSGARARRSVTNHDASRETAAFDALIAATPASYLEQVADVPRDATPIFVVGMPRTGTTLLERILGNHPQIETCGELNDFRQQMQWANNRRTSLTLDVDVGPFVAGLDANVLGKRYLAKTKWLTRGKAFYSDKHPLNMLWCGPILKALPHAKIIHLRRNPMDSCFSNLKELFAPEYYPYSYALDELAAHYRNYNRLMQHWHAIAPGRILDVRYEDLVMHPSTRRAACRSTSACRRWRASPTSSPTGRSPRPPARCSCASPSTPATSPAGSATRAAWRRWKRNCRT